jgi:hypothetical protein
MLWANRDALRSQGVHVPGREQSDHFLVGQDVLQAEPSRAFGRPRWHGALERTRRQIEDAGLPTSIVSDERLAAATPEQARRALEHLADFEVHVVYGIRDLPRLLASEWQESVKHGLHRSFPEWVGDIQARRPDDWFWRVHDVGPVLSRWSPADPGRVHVVTVPGPGAPDDELWRRFGDVVGWSVPHAVSGERSNESLGLLEATLLGRIQARLPETASPYHQDRVVRGFVVGDVLASRPDPLPIRVPVTERDWVRSETIVRIEAVTQSGFDVVGDVTDIARLDCGFGTATTDGHEAQMLDAAVDVIARLVAVQVRERVQFDLLRGRVRPLELLAVLRRRARRSRRSLHRRIRRSAGAPDG